MDTGPSIFISYPRKDPDALAFVLDLERALNERGFRVHRDVDIEPGERWPDELWTWLLRCTGAVAIISDEAKASVWCRREWSVLAAREAADRLRLVPVHVGPVESTGDILDHLQAVRPGPDALDQVVRRLDGLRHAPPTGDDFVAAHQAWLGWQFRHAPTLGREPFALADVYVETECGVLTWHEINGEPGEPSVDPFDESAGGRVPLVDAVLDRFGDPEFRDLVVVQGPAGSGKSAFCLHLADRLIAEGLTPLVVRFRDLHLATYPQVEELLQHAVRVAPVGEHPPPPAERLLSRPRLDETARFGGADISRTVVILDGWDEVSLTGSLRFKDQLDTLLPRLREFLTDRVGAPVRLLLTGRPSPAVDRSGILRRESPVLTVRPMRPEQLRAYADAVSGRLDGGDWALDPTACERAFANYGTWFEEREIAGIEVLGSPLLALLAFRTIADWPGDPDELFEGATSLYQALIDVVVTNAGKGDGAERLEGTVHRGGSLLRHLLRQVAAVITTQGEEAVSYDELRYRLDGPLTEWARRVADESTLHELVVNFYFKSNPNLGCEFLHKSFREYLFAEAVVAVLDEVSEERSGSFPTPDLAEGQDFEESFLPQHFRASRELAALLGPQWLTAEVRAHIFWLMARGIADDPPRWVWIRDLLTDLYTWWFDSAHLRPRAVRVRGKVEWEPPLIIEMIADDRPRDGRTEVLPRRTVSLDAHLGDALLQLTAFVHAETRPHAGADHRPTSADGFSPCSRVDDPDALCRVVARISAAYQRPQGDGLVGAYLRRMNLEGQNLGGLGLTDCDLREARLGEVWAVRTFLRSADLTGADLTGANLTAVNLSEATLSGACLLRATLDRAFLLEADLPGADLRQAMLRHADLRGADLTGADLRGADLELADTSHTDLTGARTPDVPDD